jgi:AraC-like DNA-binding protein
MQFQKKYPAAALTSFVRHYWYFEIDEDELPFSQLSFPYGAFELICYLQNPNAMRWLGSVNDFIEPAIFYAGQLTRPFVMSFSKKCVCVGASLQPWAGNLLYGIPSGEFTNELVPLEELETDNGFYERLKNCTDNEALFNCLEAYLLARLLNQQIDPLIFNIATHIVNNPMRGALTPYITGVGLSRRRIEQRFINATGLSMGLFTRKVRFQKAVYLLKQPYPGLNLNAIGLQVGYYDQSHFIDDFKTFSGMCPGDFVSENTELKGVLQELVLT